MTDPCANCPGTQECQMREEDRLRRRLKYFFMDPCHKWKAKRKFPWKLVLQIVKIILVTIQLALFGFLRAAHVDFIEKGNIAFKHLYLKAWDPSFETMPYPPSTGAYAVYNTADFYAHIDFALTRYDLTSELALGPYDKSMQFAILCKLFYKVSRSSAFNQTYVFNSEKIEDDDFIVVMVTSIFDVVIIIISSVSLCLCARSLHSASQLRKEVVRFFLHIKGVHLTTSDKLEFVNMWYVLIILNDLLTIVGSVMKISMQSQMLHSYEICGVLLGTGNLFVWFGVLRYLNFYEKYSILIMTLKKSIPNMLRFLACAAVFYMGFTVCGWVVLGPYHIKFRYLSSTSECLFSLINGDDMYNTFEAISSENVYAWWYSRMYLYVFISFFMYVVVNVFLSVIMDTYETIKHYCENGYPRSYLERFTDECTDTPRCLFASSPGRRCHDDTSCGAKCSSCLHSCLPFLRPRRDSDFGEDDPLLH